MAPKARDMRRPVEDSLPEGSLPESRNGQVRFVLLKRYCALTGDTPQAVHNRRLRGDWIDGQHCCLVDGRRLWINLQEVEKWVANGGRTN